MRDLRLRMCTIEVERVYT